MPGTAVEPGPKGASMRANFYVFDAHHHGGGGRCPPRSNVFLLVEDSREMFAVLEEHDMFNEVIVASDG